MPALNSEQCFLYDNSAVLVQLIQFSSFDLSKCLTPAVASWLFPHKCLDQVILITLLLNKSS